MVFIYLFAILFVAFGTVKDDYVFKSTGALCRGLRFSLPAPLFLTPVLRDLIPSSALQAPSKQFGQVQANTHINKSFFKRLSSVKPV